MRLQEALIDFAQGRRRAALEKFRQLIDEYKKQGMLERANRMQGAFRGLMAELGLIDDARKLLHSLPPINGSTDIPVATGGSWRGLAGRGYPSPRTCRNSRTILSGRTRTARRSRPRSRYPEANPKRPSKRCARDCLTICATSTCRRLRGRAYLAARQPDLAAIEFHKIVDHPTLDPLSHDLPLAHLGLARACVLQGDIAGAGTNMRSFSRCGRTPIKICRS